MIWAILIGFLFGVPTGLIIERVNSGKIEADALERRRLEKERLTKSLTELDKQLDGLLAKMGKKGD